jgi:Flp pilus assembly protein TadD
MQHEPSSVLASLDAEELLALGLQASSAGSSGEALGYYKLVIGKQPENVRAHWALAAEYASLSMADRADEHFAIALNLNPALPVARFQHGLLCLTRGDVKRAQSIWEGLDALAPFDPVRLFKDGLLLMVEDRFDEALSQIRRAMDDPSVDAALRRDMAMTVARIEATTRAEGAASPTIDAANPAKSNADETLAIQSRLAISAYRGGGSDEVE